MQGFGATRYTDLVVVGAYSSRWDSFTDDSGRPVKAGEAFYLDVAQGADALGEIGRVKVDAETFEEVTGLGFGTVIEAAGSLEHKRGRKVIRADKPGAVRVFDPAGV